MFFLFFSLIIIILSFIISFLNLFISKKLKSNKNKNSPIECGFDMMNKNFLPFSIQFYYISILFLIFDIEIALMLPMIQPLFFSTIFQWNITYFFITLILIIGLYLEWYKNLIKWNY